jgi:hypothetical protein
VETVDETGDRVIQILSVARHCGRQPEAFIDRDPCSDRRKAQPRSGHVALQFESEFPQDVRGLFLVLCVFVASAFFVAAPLSQQTIGSRGNLLQSWRYRPPKGGCRVFSNEPLSHRRNKDGTIDSICPRCYLRVGTALNESELPKIEHSHTCNPDWLLRWQLLSR